MSITKSKNIKMIYKICLGPKNEEEVVGCGWVCYED